MTTSLVLASPNLCLAASDTRLSLSSPYFGNIVTDGPGDYKINVSSRNFETIIPYRMRKISPVGQSWGATAGDFFAGTSALRLLRNCGEAEGNEATRLLLAERNEVLKASRAVGFPDESSLETRVMLAKLGGSSWHSMLKDNGFSAHDGPVSYLTNIPPAVGQKAYDQLTANWTDAISAGMKTQNLVLILRATAAFIHGVHEISICTGPRVQIGFTIASPNGLQRGYLDADASSIIKSSDGNIKSLIMNMRPHVN